MTIENAQKLTPGDIIISNDQEWEVMDIMETDDGVMISAYRNDSYDVFNNIFIYKVYSIKDTW